MEQIVDINVEKNNDLCKLQVMGEMTIINSAELKKQLLESLLECSQIEIDLSQVSEMDTAGFQLLLLVYNEASLLNKTVRITSYSSAISAVFDLYSMDKEDF